MHLAGAIRASCGVLTTEDARGPEKTLIQFK